MKTLRLSAAITGIICLAFAAFGSVCTLYTGEPVWQPLMLGAVIWMIVTPAVAGVCWLINHA